MALADQQPDDPTKTFGALRPKTTSTGDPRDTPPEASAKDTAGDENKAIENIKGRMNAEGQRNRNRELGIFDDAGRMKPPEMAPTPPPPVKKDTPIQEQWGSMAMLFAVLGSGLTRNRATTALNAAAGVMNAYHQKDQEQFDNAFARWRAANENALKSENYQLKTYNEILSGKRLEAMIAGKVSDQEQKEASSQLRAVATAFHDDLLAQRIDNQDWEGVAKIIDAREKAATQMEEKSAKLEKMKLERDAQQELEQTPEYQKATPIQKLQMSYNMRKTQFPDNDTRGDNTPNDRRNAIAIYNVTYPSQTRNSDTPPFDKWYKEEWPKWGDTTTAPAVATTAAGANMPVIQVTENTNWEQIKTPGQVIELGDGTRLRYKGGDPHDQSSYAPE